jgi:sigma-E factor negative regulatory protein RseC
MKSGSEISHEGIVESVNGASIEIAITPSGSCAGCQAAKSCNVTGSEKKIISLNSNYPVTPGERVIVSMETSQGFSALVLGYLMPLMIVIITLVALSLLSVEELIAGVVSVGILLPYYMILYLARKAIGKRYSFKLKTL